MRKYSSTYNYCCSSSSTTVQKERQNIERTVQNGALMVTLFLSCWHYWRAHRRVDRSCVTIPVVPWAFLVVHSTCSSNLSSLITQQKKYYYNYCTVCFFCVSDALLSVVSHAGSTIWPTSQRGQLRTRTLSVSFGCIGLRPRSRFYLSKTRWRIRPSFGSILNITSSTRVPRISPRTIRYDTIQ